MRDGWPDGVMAQAPRPDETFESSLRERLLDAWDHDARGPDPSATGRSRRWTVVAAAVVAAVGVAGFLIARIGASPGAPSSPSPVPSVVTATDVVGTWVVTRSGGVPRPSPLPTYHFKIGTGPAGRGVVTGFDGCREVAGTWSIDGGRLAVGIDGEPSCPDAGAAAPPVSLAGAVVTQLDGEPIIRFADANGTIARRVDALPAPAALTGASWLLPIDGPDLTLTFAADELTMTEDAIVCTRIGYRYNGAVLRLDAVHRDASTSCQSAVPASLQNTALSVVQYADADGTSLLLVTPTAGTVRLYPPPASEVQEESGATDST